jgi:oligoendopeptidase F
METNEKQWTRNEVDERYKWRLQDIFENDQTWEDALVALAGPMEKLITYKGRVGESSETLVQTLILEQECSMIIMELYTYAKMSKDLDNSNPDYQAMYDRIVGEYFKLSAQTAFISPEISAIDESILRKWMHGEKELSEYKHMLDDIIRNRTHILSEKEEKLLSGVGPVADGIEESFSMMNNVELDFGEVLMPDGEKVKLTHGKFGSLREHPDRSVREQTYRCLHTAYEQFKNTLAAIYTTSVKNDVFFSKARGFESCMSKAMFSDNLSTKIYTQLIDAIHKALPSFYQYLDLRKKVLGLDELHLYDCSVPITEEITSHYEFNESKDLLINGLSPLGDDYLDAVRKLTAGGWIDVYETKGKTSGAYAWGTYKSHPFMLLNWSGRLDDVFTLAHETGHCMHSYHSNQKQGYANSHYPIFLAEIASTVNENILLRHMIGQCDDETPEGRKEKAYLINHFLEGVKNTVFRQTMFAEFEYLVHKKIEQGEAMTAQALSDLYVDLLKLYFGNDVVIDEYMKYEWARIPHFYSAFYVYKYATGFCAAAQITQQIFREGKPAVDAYLEFLSAGGSDYPAGILSKLGIDMTKPDAVQSTMEEFDRERKALEKLLLG